MPVDLQQRRGRITRGIIIAALLMLWALNSVAFCMAATSVEAAMACCPPTDCAMASGQHNCCTVQSNPRHALVSPVVLTDHVADDGIATATQSTAISAPAVAVAMVYVAPHAPPGCHSILRI